MNTSPLLRCLLALARHYERPTSAEALLAGLPAAESLTPDLFIRAAEKIDLSAELLPCQLTSATETPLVLILEEERACVVTSIDKESATVIYPEGDNSSQSVSLSELNNTYTGKALSLVPQYRFDQRVPESAPNKKHWYWQTLWQSWPLYSEVLLASFCINLFALATPLFVMNVYDRVAPNQALETLWVLAIGVAIVFSFDFLMRGLRGYFIDVAGKRADIVLARSIFAQVLNTRTAAQPKSAGGFAGHLQEFDTFRDFFTSATLATLLDLPFATLFLIVIWILGGPLVWVPLLIIPLVLLVSLLVQKPLRRVVQHAFRINAQRQATLVESLSALETIKSLGAESGFQKRWEQAVEEAASSSLKSRFLSALSVNFATFAQQMAYVGVVVYGVYLIGDGVLTVGGLIACSILTGRALAPMAQVAGLLTRYHQSVAALRALNQIMDAPVEQAADKRFLQRPALTGDIALQEVAFSYPEQASPTLQNVSLQIQAGEKVAIIGRVGSGKSTIARLLLGLYEADGGHVMLDGTDIRQLDPADLRRHIGYVPQDVALFYGTIRDNITPGMTSADDEQVLQAARIAGVDDMVKYHPQGYDMLIGERGAGLSGGQRQLVALARALLQTPPILLLDEPSSGMDNNSEQQLKIRLTPFIEDKTLVLITHRASMLTLVDRLIVLDAGKVVADGPKEQVLQQLAEGQVKVNG
ncbi:MAG: type I secretion system permease/ATPase [Pseudomonadota bacterium]